MRKEIILKQPQKHKRLNVRRLMTAIIWGNTRGWVDKTTADVAQELEEEAMNNLETAKEVEAEWECEQCSGTGISREADGEDDILKEICECRKQDCTMSPECPCDDCRAEDVIMDR